MPMRELYEDDELSASLSTRVEDENLSPYPTNEHPSSRGTNIVKPTRDALIFHFLKLAHRNEAKAFGSALDHEIRLTYFA